MKGMHESRRLNQTFPCTRDHSPCRGIRIVDGDHGDHFLPVLPSSSLATTLHDLHCLALHWPTIFFSTSRHASAGRIGLATVAIGFSHVETAGAKNSELMKRLQSEKVQQLAADMGNQKDIEYPAWLEGTWQVAVHPCLGAGGGRGSGRTKRTDRGDRQTDRQRRREMETERRSNAHACVRARVCVLARKLLSCCALPFFSPPLLRQQALAHLSPRQHTALVLPAKRSCPLSFPSTCVVCRSRPRSTTSVPRLATVFWVAPARRLTNGRRRKRLRRWLSDLI